VVVLLAWEAVASRLLVPYALQVSTGDGELGLAALQLEPAQLAAFGCPPPLRAEALCRGGNFAAARGERFDEALWHSRDLEVATLLARPCPDLITTLGELEREC
jgi:hypothetical protein